MEEISEGAENKVLYGDLTGSYIDRYIKYYSEQDSAIAVLSEFTSIEKKLEEHLQGLKDEVANLRLEYLKGVEKIFSGRPKIANEFGEISAEKFKQFSKGSKLKFKIITQTKYYLSDTIERAINPKVLMDLFNLTNELIVQSGKEDVKISEYFSPLSKAFEKRFLARKVSANLSAIKDIQERIIYSEYSDNIEHYYSISAEEFEKNDVIPNSNHDKLYKSAKWMDEFVRNLIHCRSEVDVLNNLRKIDKDFKKPFPNKSLYFKTSERINNSQIAECLALLHNKKNDPDNKVTANAIIKKYPELSLS